MPSTFPAKITQVDFWSHTGERRHGGGSERNGDGTRGRADPGTAGAGPKAVAKAVLLSTDPSQPRPGFGGLCVALGSVGRADALSDRPGARRGGRAATPLHLRGRRLPRRGPGPVLQTRPGAHRNRPADRRLCGGPARGFGTGHAPGEPESFRLLGGRGVRLEASADLVPAVAQRT